MKKRNKLNVNFKKEISDAELVNLKGGSGEDYYCGCTVWWVEWTQQIYGYSYVPCDLAAGVMLEEPQWRYAVNIVCYDV